MNLYIVMVFLPGASSPVQLKYKDLDNADSIAKGLADGTRNVVNDDFGGTFYRTSQPSGVSVMDAAEALNGEIEFQMLQARGQMKAQQKLRGDPTLSNGIMMPPSTSILGRQ